MAQMEDIRVFKQRLKAACLERPTICIPLRLRGMEQGRRTPWPVAKALRLQGEWRVASILACVWSMVELVLLVFCRPT